MGVGTSVNCPYACLIAATILKIDFAWFMVLAVKHDAFADLYAQLETRTRIFFFCSPSENKQNLRTVIC
jgi:hypothetical protein